MSSKKPSQRAIQIDLDGAEPRARFVVPSDELLAQHNTPLARAKRARFEAAMAKPPVVFALAQQTMGRGVIATLVIDPGADPERLIVLSAADLDDARIGRVSALLLSYEVNEYPDRGRATLAVHADGRVVVDDANGKRESKPRVRHLAATNGRERTALLLDRAKHSPDVVNHHVGKIRVVR